MAVSCLKLSIMKKDLVKKMQQTLSELNISDLKGIHRTYLPGTKLYRDTQGNPRNPLLYNSGIIIMLQGSKTLFLEQSSVTYQAGDYLLLGVPMPVECEAWSTPQAPILSLIIDVPLTVLNDIHQHVHFQQRKHIENRADLFSLTKQSLTETLNDACFRLLNALSCKTQSAVLGESIVKEIIYHIVTGPHGYILTDLVDYTGHYARVAKALTTIHSNYSTALSVEELADDANMSVSSFHRVFRQVTTISPGQYIKRVRLTKARELIAFQGRRANEAASLVGYSSASQFSREFKRYFNTSPSESRG